MSKKVIINIIACIAALAISAAVIISACLGSNQSATPIIVPIRFEGEYSYDGGESWAPVSEAAKLSALKGDIILRGRLLSDFPAVSSLNFYLNHITAEIYVNGEQCFWDSRNEIGLTASGCCVSWANMREISVSPDDEIEFHLSNPHKFGNNNAYNEFLSSLCNGEYDAFSVYIERSGLSSRIIGFVLIVAALMLLAIALAVLLLRIKGGADFGTLGAVALFFGGIFVFNTYDISMWSELKVFNTYGLMLCVMLAGFFTIVSIRATLKSKAKSVAFILEIISCAALCTLVIPCLFGCFVIYDTMPYWLAVNGVLFAVLLGCAVYELFAKCNKDYIDIVTEIILILAFLVDIFAAFTDVFQPGLCSKWAFPFLFLVHLVRLIKDIPADYFAARQAERLKAELAESRISIMLSQLQPHFLYNCLNSIYYLCEKNPKAAKTAISEFSAYLRGNMNSLTSTSPIPFYKELEHLKNYLALEKMRFEDTLKVEWDIHTKDFMIPVLTVQPLVENAVKHGICNSENGGTVRISSAERGEFYEVLVSDNGEGFNIAEISADGTSHLGIENVRNRLEKMCGGELIISSEKGKGTTALIRIPKNG
ncbi:MAG: sensor histidine kinase [Ruminiclostridium sp.]